MQSGRVRIPGYRGRRPALPGSRSRNTLHEQTHHCRVYLSTLPPGFLQTPAFATALMTQITRFQGTPDDVAEAVAARVARSRFLYEGGHRYVVLMEKSVLRFRTADPDAMRASSATVMPLASLSLGIIPFTAQRTVWPLEAFYLHDAWPWSRP